MPSQLVPEMPTSLARRVAGYASNILATGVVLLAALVFGTQISGWWRVDKQPLAAADHVTSVVGAPAPFGTGWLQFGDSKLAIHCATFAGDEKAAFERLRRHCHEAASAFPLFGRTLAVAEGHLLQRLHGKTPVEQDVGNWYMYEIMEGLPIVVVVRDARGPGSSPQVADADRRVISLGMAFPRTDRTSPDQQTWNLMVCAQGEQPSSDSHLPFPAAPTGAKRLLAIRSNEGTQLCSWSGTGTAEQWQAAFDQWHQSQGWTPVSSWKQLERNWHRRYEHNRNQFADIQFTEISNGSLSGYWTHSEFTSPR